jgi:hypothetical protein
MTETEAKRHLLRLQNFLEKEEKELGKHTAVVVSGSTRAFNLKTIQALNTLIFDAPPKKAKPLSKRAQKVLAQAGCSSVEDHHFTLGPTALRVVLSKESIEDINAQVRGAA